MQLVFKELHLFCHKFYQKHLRIWNPLRYFVSTIRDSNSATPKEPNAMNAPYAIVCEFEKMSVANISTLAKAATQLLAMRMGYCSIVATVFDADGYIVSTAELKEAIRQSVIACF